MVRGCQKRIIYLKSTGSEVFDEAYFVVRDEALSNIGECDMVKEANRILDECISLDGSTEGVRVIPELIKRKAIPFFTGMVIGIIIAILIK